MDSSNGVKREEGVGKQESGSSCARTRFHAQHRRSKRCSSLSLGSSPLIQKSIVLFLSSFCVLFLCMLLADRCGLTSENSSGPR